MSARVAVVTFPGSLDDRDAMRAVRLMGGEPVPVWHGDRDLRGADAVILPGGFSYGDYLRTGAIARFARVMDAVRKHAERGGPVLGICNGFQILSEAGLLPGALIRNRTLSFICRRIHVRCESAATPFTHGVDPAQALEIPIKHGEGQFVADAETLERLEGDGRVVFRYCSPAGEVGDAWNPNGAANAIAGIANERGNIVGLMPHPEHAVDPDVGPTGGRAIFESLLTSVLAAAR
ncbi:MAG TPA: phosphoribosylformylglycinamidine synthase subunit PurQ [Actinomycetota bacterium]|nr:phosphoribosylformylglycinamidine synthase subunit PurQ [Actinomycetota bacterium]